MRYSSANIVFQEIPNEISFAFHITGCPLKCVGCHSTDTWSSKHGELFSLEVLVQFIEKHKSYITCVLFLGGEWEQDFIQYLQLCRQSNLKTALYTGLDYHQVSSDIISNLDYIKYGPYLKELGGLESKTTNQKLINLNTGDCLNSFFHQEGL